MWHTPPETITERWEERFGSKPKIWSCPCGAEDCINQVVYGRDAENRVAFIPTVTYDERRTKRTVIYSIENVEDIGEMLEDENIHANDRMIFAVWFNLGLREALLNA